MNAESQSYDECSGADKGTPDNSSSTGISVDEEEPREPNNASLKAK